MGHELELYRNARGIKEKLAEKKRYWRLEYADGLSHMDIVRGAREDRKRIVEKRMVENLSLMKTWLKTCLSLQFRLPTTQIPLMQL